MAHTLLGIGAIDETHPLTYGFMGMHGWKHVNRAIQSADLLIALGHALRRPGHRQRPHLRARTRGSSTSTSTRPRSARTWPSRCPSSATPKRVLRALTPLVDAVEPADARATYLAQLAEWRRDSEGASWHGSGAWRDGLLSADYVIERIGELTDHDATYVADVGQNQMWLARYAGFRQPELARQLGWPGDDGLRRAGGDGRGARPARQGDLGDRRRRRLPDDLPGADDPGRRTGSRSRSRCSTTRSWG